MLDLLVVALLALHLLLVDIAMAAPLACIWLEMLGTRRGDPAAESLARRLAGVAMGALAGGVAWRPAVGDPLGSR